MTTETIMLNNLATTQYSIEDVLKKVFEVLDGYTTDFTNKLIYLVNLKITHANALMITILKQLRFQFYTEWRY